MSSRAHKEYHKNRVKRIVISVLLILALLVLEVYSLSINDFPITFEEAWHAVYNRIRGIEPQTYIDMMIDYVAIEVNAPRAIAAVLIGIILAVCGAVMQTVTHNPLAEPYTIGISSAALFGVSIALIYGVSLFPWVGGDMAAGSNAFIFAMIPALTIVAISSVKKLSPNMMILIGIGMMYMFTSMTTFLKFNASEETLQEIYTWSLGTLTSTTWDEIPVMAVTAVLVLAGFMFLAKDLNVLSAGDKVCQTLGVHPIRTRIVSFVIVSIGVAVCVCYTGTIGFVGLVAPHIARLFTGNNNRILIPAAAIIGALMILVSDIAVRSLPGGLPAGVVTALIGSPLFLFFMYRQKKQNTF